MDKAVRSLLRWLRAGSVESVSQSHDWWFLVSPWMDSVACLCSLFQCLPTLTVSFPSSLSSISCLSLCVSGHHWKESGCGFFIPFTGWAVTGPSASPQMSDAQILWLSWSFCLSSCYLEVGKVIRYEIDNWKILGMILHLCCYIQKQLESYILSLMVASFVFLTGSKIADALNSKRGAS